VRDNRNLYYRNIVKNIKLKNMNILSILDLDVEKAYKILASTSCEKWYLNLNDREKNQVKDNIGDLWRKKIIDLEKISNSNSKLLKVEGYSSVMEFGPIDKSKYRINKILILGTGYSNETANGVADNFPLASIYCLDNSSDVIKFCTMNYDTSKFTYLLDSVEYFDYSNFDFIFLTSGLTNKIKILNQILNTSDKCLIALRNPKMAGEIIYEKISFQFLMERFNILDKISTTAFTDTIFIQHKKKLINYNELTVEKNEYHI